MPAIVLKTLIKEDINVVFDLAKSIDLHMLSTEQTNEKAIAGKTSGLIELGEFVTWRAKHFGVYQTLTTKITVLEKPRLFVDEQTKGIFKSFRHEHLFEETEKGTLMVDKFEYESPLGFLGRLMDWLIIKNYMIDFLKKRNMTIKRVAETNGIQKRKK